VDLGPGESAAVNAYYQTTGLGSGTISLGANGSAIDDGSYSISVDLSAPVISLLPHSSGVLSGGFDVMFSHSTPAYFSLGQARGVTVAYNSSTVRPTPVLLVDVSNSGQPYPTGYSVQVRRASNNTLLDLLNASQTVFYTPATNQPLRLAVALDAQTNGLGTGWHDVTVTVTSQFSGTTRSTTVPTRLIVVDQTGSPFGKGVDLAGVQRVRTMLGSYSVLVTEGDGSGVFFEAWAPCPTCGVFTSPAGEASTLSKVTDPNPALTIYRRRYPDGSVVEFSNDGRMLRALGLFGDTTRFIWTDTLLTQIRDPMGKALTLVYSGGRLQSVTDPAGRVTTYSIDGSARLFRITDPDTVATNLAYDANSLLTSVTDRGGATASFTYDALRRVDTTYAPMIQIYTGANVRPRSVVTAPERVVWQPGTAGTSAANAKLAVRPDTLFAIAVGPLGEAVKTALDRFGSPTRIVGPYGETATITRDTLGRALVGTEPNGHVMRLSYSSGFLGAEYFVGQAKDSTTGRTVSYTYGVNGAVTRASGDVTQQDFVYHTGTNGPVGAVDSVLGANRAVIYSVHRPDARGRDTLVTDGGQHATRIKYDTAWGHVRETTDPRGSVSRFHFDAAGRVDSAWVPASGLVTYQYDALNRQTQVKNPLGYVTRYIYGPTVLNRVVDPKGQIYKFAYNALGLLVAQHDLSDTLKADTLKYDEAGNVRAVRTRRGDVITMTYDLAGRVVSRAGPDFPVDSFKYDPADRWMVAWNVNQRDSSAFDKAGRLAATRQAMLGGVAYQLSYSYDIQDRLRTRSAPTGGNLARYVYNSTTGVLDTLCAASGCVALRRNGELLTDRSTYNPGQSGSWFWERAITSDHRTASDSFSVGTLDDLYGTVWTYDSIGRIATLGTNQVGRRYTYDGAGRLRNDCKLHPILGCVNEYGGPETRTCMTPPGTVSTPQLTRRLALVTAYSRSRALHWVTTRTGMSRPRPVRAGITRTHGTG
jgi:YD repeat-containing protein